MVTVKVCCLPVRKMLSSGSEHEFEKNSADRYFVRHIGKHGVLSEKPRVPKILNQKKEA